MPGSFLTATSYATGVRSWTIAAAELNGDGKQDLVVGNQGSFNGGSVSVFLQNPASPRSADSFTRVSWGYQAFSQACAFCSPGLGHFELYRDFSPIAFSPALSKTDVTHVTERETASGATFPL